MTDAPKKDNPKRAADDRTLLDPLSADELKALREAHARTLKEAPRSIEEVDRTAVAHHMVVGVEGADANGTAPTMAMPVLPAFEDTGASLASIDAHSATLKITRPPVAAVSNNPEANAATELALPPAVQAPPNFGQNTLMWMQAAKSPHQTAVLNARELASLKNNKARNRLGAIVVGVALAVVAGVLFASMGTQEKGLLEIHTTPPKAEMIIDGKHQGDKLTPVKLTLPVGRHTIELKLADHEPHQFDVSVTAGEELTRQEIALVPISKPGLMTIQVSVLPVAANVVVDNVEYPQTRSVMVANVDPAKSHILRISAGGYVSVEQRVAAGDLRGKYHFVLQQDQEAKAK